VKLSALTDDLLAAMPSLRFGERLLLRVPGGVSPVEVALTWARTFGDVPEDAPLLTADSYGRVALSVHQGSAAHTYGISRDAVLEVSRPPAAPLARRPSRPPPSGAPPSAPRSGPQRPPAR
jgi:hypothetical protein